MDLRVDGRPMRVLFVNQFFHPDIAATSQIVTDLAVDLAARGAQVTAVAGRGSYLGDRSYGPRETYQGVDILRVPSTNFGKASIPRRMADYLSFYAACAGQIALLPRQDVVITLSTPPLVSLLGSGTKAGTLARTKFVYWVQDLYPDVAVKLGVLGEKSAATYGFEALARASLKSADAVVALGDDMADRLAKKGAPRDRLHVVHNWSNGDTIGSVESAENWFLDQHGLRGKSVILYSGNMGRGHEFGTLLDAANRLQQRDDIVFLFIGDGAKKAEVEAFSKTHANVRLLPYQKREDLPYSLGAGDLLTITLSDGLAGLIVPSKLYGALAAKKAVLYIGPQESDVARIVSEHRCGGTFRHGDVEGVARFITRIADDRAEARAMGLRGRAAFDQSYDRRQSTAKFAEILTSLVR